MEENIKKKNSNVIIFRIIWYVKLNLKKIKSKNKPMLPTNI